MIINLLGRNIEVYFVDKIPEEHDYEQNSIGLFVDELDTIYILDRLSDDKKRRTLIHELFHALMYASGQQHHFSSKQQEAMCDLAENFLDLTIIKDLKLCPPMNMDVSTVELLKKSSCK